MSSDYTNSKKNQASTYPESVIDSASFGRVEPLPTPEKIKRRYLRGLSLVSPVTGQVMNDEDIKDDVIRAVSRVESDLKMRIFPQKFRKRLPFQREDYESYIFTILPDTPIISVDKMSITSANGVDMYQIPPEWIDTANFNAGIINVLPIMAVSDGPSSTYLLGGGSGGIGNFLLYLGQQPYIPSYWQVEYTAGFNMEQGIPTLISDLIGMKAAMMALQNMIPQVQFSSHSLGLDGVSQGQSNQAAQLYEKVYGMLEAQYEGLKKNVQSEYNASIILNSLS